MATLETLQISKCISNVLEILILTFLILTVIFAVFPDGDIAYHLDPAQ